MLIKAACLLLPVDAKPLFGRPLILISIAMAVIVEMIMPECCVNWQIHMPSACRAKALQNIFVFLLVYHTRHQVAGILVKTN